ncbi:unnamed protein product [Rotaria sp. Silwood1]|nr:unnamed protein product [Rotaria sp. Silwood1]CAF1652730.1 unnamed protein product [Rotaria sp. Silwood1]
MSSRSQDKHPEQQRSQEIKFQTYNNNIQQQQLLTQRSVQSTQTSSSSSLNNETNERYLSQQIRTTQVTVNLIDCMECYVRTPRCTFEQQAADYNGSPNKDMVQQVQEFRQEQEQASPIQKNDGRNETVEKKEDGRNDNLIHYFNDEDAMMSLLIVDLPWSQTSQYNSANDEHPDSIEEVFMLLLQNQDTSEDEFIQFLKDHIDYLNIEENFSELLHSIFRNISVNDSLFGVSNQMEDHHAMIDDNDEDLYVDYLVDDYNVGENDMDANDEYQV